MEKKLWKTIIVFQSCYNCDKEISNITLGLQKILTIFQLHLKFQKDLA